MPCDKGRAHRASQGVTDSKPRSGHNQRWCADHYQSIVIEGGSYSLQGLGGDVFGDERLQRCGISKGIARQDVK